MTRRPTEPSSDSEARPPSPAVARFATSADSLASAASTPHITDRELFERLAWFISIRWVAGVAALLLVFIGWQVFGVRIPPRPVVLTIATLFMYNALFLLLVTDAHRRGRVNKRFNFACANAQIVCDLVTLAVLVHWTGGVENYFIVFFVCPTIVASELLTTRNAYVHAALGSLLIHGVAWGEYAGVLGHVVVGRAFGAETYRSPIAVTKFTVALSLLLFATVFLAGSIASRLRRREEELEDAHNDLQRLEKTKSFFMRQTSHELRAPLSAVVSMLQALEMGATDQADEPMRRFLARAKERTQSLTRLIEELHRYAALRETAGALRREPIDLARAVQDNVRLYTPLAERKTIAMSGQASGPTWIQGNREAIDELIGNLITNAIQYTPAGGAVRLRLSSNGEAAQLEVEDTGIGIPPESIDRVFEQYYRCSNAKRTFRNGTGMGLPIVRQIVETHGGRIEVRSELERGTTFMVTLPASEPGTRITAARVHPPESG
jgi:signal transduction histidine kinase